MNGAWWHDPDYRRDVLIVVGLFGVGLLFNVLIGAVVVVLFDLLGLWGAESVEGALNLQRSYVGSDT